MKRIKQFLKDVVAVIVMFLVLVLAVVIGFIVLSYWLDHVVRFIY